MNIKMSQFLFYLLVSNQYYWYELFIFSFFNYQMASSVKIIQCGAEDEILSVESSFTLPESEPLLSATIPGHSLVAQIVPTILSQIYVIDLCLSLTPFLWSVPDYLACQLMVLPDDFVRSSVLSCSSASCSTRPSLCAKCVLPSLQLHSCQTLCYCMLLICCLILL